MVFLGTANIILADDDDDDQFMFKEALEELGSKANLVTANNGEELMDALHKLTDKLPDLLFLDLNMPRKNGFQCLVEIRQHEKFNGIRTIIFSTSSEGEVIERLYQNGADHYIKKPTEFSELKRVIERALKTVDAPFVKPSMERFVL